MGNSYVRAGLLALICLVLSNSLFAQDRIITVPKPVQGAPFKVTDEEDLFGKAYRWFLEGEVEWAADSLAKLIGLSGFSMNPNDYHIVVADYGDEMVPIGMLHAGSDFTDTRLYGLKDADLYYIFISEKEKAENFLSVTLTRKDSPFQQGLLDFVSLFLPLEGVPLTTQVREVWLDIRKFEIPEKFQSNSDINVIVKRQVDSEDFLATALFDNTAREHWSFGIATAITTVDDVDFIVDQGRIVIRPKPQGDFAMFGVINYHFQAVDTKQPTVPSSFHLLAGLRLDNTIEPIVGLGFGFPTGIPVEVHFFGGISVEFANELKSGFSIGQEISEEVDPFGLELRVRPRFGLELKFP